MKKLTLFLSILLLLQSQTTEQLPDQALPLLVAAGEGQGWELKSWQAINISHLTEKEFKTFINDTKENYISTINDDENAVKYTFEYQHNDEAITHTFYVVKPKKNHEKIKLQTIISGNNWNTQTNHSFDQLTRSLQERYTLKFTKNFTCLYFEESG